METAPSRNPLRRLYLWVLSWADRPAGAWALFFLALAESSFFPIPPDVLLIALILGRREKAAKYAAICLAGSVLGGALGYGIGWGLWEATRDFWLTYVFSEKAFFEVSARYREYGGIAVFAAAFTPIPYKVFTIAGGVCGINFAVFLLASVAGRGLRFALVAALLYFVGPRAKRFIDRRFNWLTLLFVALLILGFWFLTRA